MTALPRGEVGSNANNPIDHNGKWTRFGNGSPLVCPRMHGRCLLGLLPGTTVLTISTRPTQPAPRISRPRRRRTSGCDPRAASTRSWATRSRSPHGHYGRSNEPGAALKLPKITGPCFEETTRWISIALKSQPGVDHTLDISTVLKASERLGGWANLADSLPS